MITESPTLLNEETVVFPFQETVKKTTEEVDKVI
jgi:hypothetical protein